MSGPQACLFVCVVASVFRGVRIHCVFRVFAFGSVLGVGVCWWLMFVDVVVSFSSIAVIDTGVCKINAPPRQLTHLRTPPS